MTATIAPLARSTLIGLALFLLALTIRPARAEGFCDRVVFEETGYVVCTVDPARNGIQIRHADPDGKVYGSFRALEIALAGERSYLRFATNGGMYHPDMSPVGLYVEYGHVLTPLNLNGGKGNFFLRPNGVFYVRPGQAGVMESRAYARAGIKPLFATQSGPMLVIDGKLHPRFDPAGTSRKRRNGVGIAADGRVIFAISDGGVNFFDFARLFRDVYGCRNALYLDGTISSLRVPEWRRNDSLFPLGIIISVEDMIPG
jgi:uncharacterized protein YigE (DUF2233 family)